MSDQTSTAGDTTATTGTPPAAQGSQPDYKSLYEQANKDATEWRNRFSGLQGKYQQEQNKWTTDAGTLIDLQSKFSEVTGLREQLEIQNKELSEQLETAASEKDILNANLERITIVTTEFPDLVPFLKDGLIPDESGDELRTKLGILQTRINEIKTTSTEQVVNRVTSGGSPNGSPASISNSPSELLKQAIDAMRQGKIEEYNELYNRYLESTQGG